MVRARNYTLIDIFEDIIKDIKNPDTITEEAESFIERCGDDLSFIYARYVERSFDE